MDNYKPGGGNKPQPYVPKGNGDKSGEYTDKAYYDYKLINVSGKCNYINSPLVKIVTKILVAKKGESIPTISAPNSVCKKVINGVLITERYYDQYGVVYLDIDYTNHGNSKTHKQVPHIHKWVTLNGKLQRLK